MHCTCAEIAYDGARSRNPVRRPCPAALLLTPAETVSYVIAGPCGNSLRP